MQHVALDAGRHPATSQEGDPRATATTPECPPPARGPAEPRHEADRAGRRDLGFPFAPVSEVGTRHRGGKAVDAGQLDSRCCNYNLYVQSTNIRKHGIGFDTARRIFEGTVATSPDRRRDYGEDRHISIGRVEPGALIVVAHTERRGRIRLISARPASRKERKVYHERTLR